MQDKKRTEDDQVNIQDVCKHLDIGRYDLIELSAWVARAENLRPVEALNKLLTIESLEVYIKEVKEKLVKEEFNKKF
jgi:hypothetical protein